jgi:antitoxin component HigA of HigAB toxin-antitoxin module
MKNNRKNTKSMISSFLLKKKELKLKSIQSLRTSFEIEGIFFSDEEIREMVAESASA